MGCLLYLIAAVLIILGLWLQSYTGWAWLLVIIGIIGIFFGIGASDISKKEEIKERAIESKIEWEKKQKEKAQKQAILSKFRRPMNSARLLLSRVGKLELCLYDLEGEVIDYLVRYPPYHSLESYCLPLSYFQEQTKGINEKIKAVNRQIATISKMVNTINNMPYPNDMGERKFSSTFLDDYNSSADTFNWRRKEIISKLSYIKSEIYKIDSRVSDDIEPLNDHINILKGR